MQEFDPQVPRDVPSHAEQEGQTLMRLAGLMRRLLASDGCPWDREQTLQSLKVYLQEESAEVLDAIDGGVPKDHCEELGDLLFQIVFQTEIARQAGHFGLDDVVEGIVAKLVRRHPHVFGTERGADREQIRRNWQAIKEAEKGPRRTLDGIPRNLSALQRAQKISVRAAEKGFDWPTAKGAWDKVEEEQGEFFKAMTASNRDHAEAEFGDMLFALVNYARHIGIDPERALHRTNDKFTKRFAHVERRTLEKHGRFDGVSLEEMDAYWNEAKQS